MRTSTCSLIATLVAALSLLPSSAPAQTSQTNKRATPSKSTNGHTSARPSKGSRSSKRTKPGKGAGPGSEAVAKARARNYDFLADEIDGNRILPDDTTIFGRQVVLHDSLIRVRTEFISEIIKSAE